MKWGYKGVPDDLCRIFSAYGITTGLQGEGWHERGAFSEDAGYKSPESSQTETWSYAHRGWGRQGTGPLCQRQPSFQHHARYIYIYIYIYTHITIYEKGSLYIYIYIYISMCVYIYIYIYLSPPAATGMLPNGRRGVARRNVALACPLARPKSQRTVAPRCYAIVLDLEVYTSDHTYVFSSRQSSETGLYVYIYIYIYTCIHVIYIYIYIYVFISPRS